MKLGMEAVFTGKTSYADIIRDVKPSDLHALTYTGVGAPERGACKPRASLWQIFDDVYILQNGRTWFDGCFNRGYNHLDTAYQQVRCVFF
ncbi:MAG: hypothetical protein M3Z08_03255 [Chloroflexota bacterium]|nr:hypothetical protein [Chloroflexota bacterium]